MRIEQLKNKKIAIAGLGTNNKKLAEYFDKQGIKYSVVEWISLTELKDKFIGSNIIFRTPGLPYLSEAIQSAKKSGIEISSQTKLFFELCPAPIIGVTGTKGKGTTSSLIAKILEADGKQVWLGGNIGRDPFEFLDQIKKEDLVVLELSSFQLQDMQMSPHIAVVLSVTADHLNHHKSLDEYISAKSNILAFQSENDFAVLHAAVPMQLKNLGKGKKIFLDPKSAANFHTKLLGRHNWDNIAAAVAVAEIVKIDSEIIKKAVAEFEALPHRLKVLKKVNGITFIDDAFSTNIDPAVAAIEAVKEPLVLIVGGSDKGLDFKKLGEKIISSPQVKGLVVMGEVSNKILESVIGFKGQTLTGARTMSEIISQAKSLAQTGDVILFSPATASFDLFKNETDRAEQFVNAVNKL